MFDAAKFESLSSELYKVMKIGVDTVLKGYHHAMYQNHGHNLPRSLYTLLKHVVKSINLKWKYTFT